MDFVKKPIAYLALAHDIHVTANAMRQAVRDWLIARGTHVLVSPPVRPDSSARDGIIMTIGSLPMLMIPLARALPGHLFCGDISQNHAFPGWRAALARHRSHVIVSPLLDAGASWAEHRAAALTTLEAASALACLPDAVGVLWGPSGVFQDRAMLAERRPQHRRTNAELMIRLCWSGRPRTPGDGVRVLTRGLAVFTGRELLHEARNAGPEIVYGRVLAACARLIAAGTPDDGGGIAGWDDDRFRIVDDCLADGRAVLRLETAAGHLAMVS